MNDNDPVKGYDVITVTDHGLPIEKDCCAAARRLLADSTVLPDDILEFYRGDMLCLRGTARAFAGRMVSEGSNGPRHVPYKPFDATWKATASTTVPAPVRLKE